MKHSLRMLRVLLVVAVSLVVATPVALYVLLSTPWAQERLCAGAEAELGRLLGTDVQVGAVQVHPFNRIDVHSISLADDHGHPCLAVERLSVRFELYHFLRTRRIVFDYALIDRPTLRLSRTAPGAPLNVQRILARLKGSDGSPAARFRFKVATLALRDGTATYDVASAPAPDSARFSPAHIALSGLQLHACLRLISNDALDIELDRLALRERSGLELRSLSGTLRTDTSGISLQGMSLLLRNSSLALSADYSPATRAWHAATDTAATSLLYLPDLAPLVPALAESYIGVDFGFSARGDSTTATLDHLAMATRDDALALSASGGALGLGTPAEQLWLSHLDLRADAPRLAAHIARFSPGARRALPRIAPLGRTRISASATLTARSEAGLNISAATAAGTLRATATALSPDTFATATLRTSASLADIRLGTLAAVPALGTASATLSADGRLSRRGFAGTAALTDASVELNGHRIAPINARTQLRPGFAAGMLEIDHSDLRLALSAQAARATTPGGTATLDLEGDIAALSLHSLGLTDAYPGYTLSAAIDTHLSGRNADDAEGTLALADIEFRNPADPDAPAIALQGLRLSRDVHSRPALVEIASDCLNGRIEGTLTPSQLGPQMRAIAAAVFPALGLAPDADADAAPATTNDFDFELTLAESENISRFFGLPVHIIHPVDISGTVAGSTGGFNVSVDAPYLRQGDKIIDNTAIYAAADASTGRATLYATTHLPTKKGPMGAVLSTGAADNTITTSVDWTIERRIPLNGTLSLAAALRPGADSRIAADIDINPGTINFGDDVWTIHPAAISWDSGTATVSSFALTAGTQRIAIDGTATAAQEPPLLVSIDSVSLLPIFETLEIDKALLSGTATGLIEGRALLSPHPVLTSERLHVAGIGYNRCTLGDADVHASWDNDTKAILLDALLTEPGGRHSTIRGSIAPATERLDITFLADRVRVGFMQPFMAAFASRVDGYASGRARLFGTFKYIDLEGDIFADSLALKIDFTNTEYYCTDSVHIRPGIIRVDRALIRDTGGHTALLSGTVRHEFFKLPSFDFAVSDARDFLCYNVGPKQSPDWYGTIYGNGGAHIHGAPGVVNIDVAMATAPGSTFTFVLNDMLEADEYSFITFRDRTPAVATDSVVAVEAIPAAVLAYRERMQAAAHDEPSDYNMDFRVDVTPDALVRLVMDPVGGDQIKAYGNGSLRLTYGSANNDLRMFGTYTLDRGSYNFTLQDIIIKDFTIDEGSSIAFHGDPYAAQLDIEAAYAVNANLSDLDESFLQDRDLNRTNVPVHALMKVTGDMRQPDIAFDLRFPTLTSDVYRKVRSIVSTEEMMNRQIIYLLALNRFYTPDYMSTTKGNELFSVASSSISSQLSSMLGKLSDNWTIAPNLRSDRGDFSDVEVDVALSSRLLNNRLLFNGNFGYRDKSLNTNQFVGDFDIEYLLNRRGTWRLKAYNRYNDQNYYLRSAATTQGLGIMFKHDFDHLFRKSPKSDQSDQSEKSEKSDSSDPSAPSDGKVAENRKN